MVLRSQEALDAFDATTEQFTQNDFHGFVEVVELPQEQLAHVRVRPVNTPAIYKDWGTGISIDIHSLPEPVEEADYQGGHFNIAVGSLVVGGPGLEVIAHENYQKPLPFALTRLAPKLGLWVVDAALQDIQGQRIEASRDYELQTGPTQPRGLNSIKPLRYQLKELYAAQEALMAKKEHLEEGEAPSPEWYEQLDRIRIKSDQIYLRYKRPVLHPTPEDITPLIDLIENRSAA